MRYTEKNERHRSKEEAIKNPHGFNYDENSVNYRTQIASVPQKLKNKPDQSHFQKKLKSLEAKVSDLKQQREQKKKQYKQIMSNENGEVDQIKKNIELGRRCIKFLKQEERLLQEDYLKFDLEYKNLQQEKNKLKQEFNAQKKPYGKKKYEDMTFKQNTQEQERLKMTLIKNEFSKKEQDQVYKKIETLKKLLIELESDKNAQKKDENDEKGNHFGQVSFELNKVRKIRQLILDRIEKNKYKHGIITEDIQQFLQKVIQISNKDAHYAHSLIIFQEVKVLKEKIKALKEEINKLYEDHDKKKEEFDYEQELIKWTAWAQGVQEKKKKEWEIEKAQRKRQKAFGDKKEESSNTTHQQIKINKNQNYIDCLAELVAYCEQLKPKQPSSDIQNKNQTKQESKQQWNQFQGLKIISSKKENKEVNERRNKKETGRVQEKQSEPKTTKLIHQFRIMTMFDDVKVLLPKDINELQQTIDRLTDKLQYYQAHPDEQFTTKPAVDQNKNLKNKPANKKKINIEDFDSLI